MSEQPFPIPILLLTFNRPDTTQEVLCAIRKARPAQLFVATDAPRKDHPEDKENCKKVMEIIQQQVDWDCKLSIRTQNENVGPTIAISSSINWFFSQVEEGIIFEDDCVPDQSFFPFCQKMLEKYRDDERVMMITGTNFLFLKYEMPETYFFSKYYPQWGWATWRRAWNLYDLDMKTWPRYRDTNQLAWIYPDWRMADWYHYMFQKFYGDPNFEAWDVALWYTCIFQNGLCIVPKYNLISNIGVYGYNHTDNQEYNQYIRMPIRSIDTDNIIHPPTVIENAVYDRITIDRVYGKSYSPMNRFIFRLRYFREKIKHALFHKEMLPEFRYL
jgi:hypothetical protein